MKVNHPGHSAAVLAAAALIFSLFAAPSTARAEQRHPSPDEYAVQELVLIDGSRLYGMVESDSPDAIVFKTTSGAIVTAARDRIVSLRTVVGRISNGEFRRSDPNDTRLLFGPTGRSLAKGETYLGVYEFFMPFVQVGITDYISIGGGTPLFFGIGDESQRPYWITPKVRLMSSAGTHVSAGVFHAFSGDGDRFGVAYGVVTKDVRGGSVTAGAGLGYTSEGDRGGVVMIGADAPMRRNMKLVTENYVFRSGGVGSVGVRFFGENLSADVAVGIAFTPDGVFGLPVVNFVYRF